MHLLDTILLPKLGQLVRNPLDPELNNFVPSKETLAALVHSEPVPEVPFHGKLGIDQSGWLQVAFAKVFGAAVYGSDVDVFDISADRKVYEGLDNANTALKTVCQDSGARTWMLDLATNKIPFYFVIGLTRLENARFQRLVADGAGGQASVTLPLDPSAPLPIRMSTGWSSNKVGFVDSGVSGIFGLKLFRAKWSWFGNEDMPKWDDKPHWRFTHTKTKGIGGGEGNIGLELEAVEEIEELIRTRESVVAPRAHDPDNE
ncbi:hypothetical protein GQ44DRAFT_733876 [Phaeosphaeriaceae sp. PMI808]|nr:hypothetical protein GQ44DRAFT_733876 [Phaeosphaeriaceae sp. PMI808]